MTRIKVFFARIGLFLMISATAPLGLVFYFLVYSPWYDKIMKRHKLSKKNSRKIFAKGVRIKPKNFKPVMRGGTRL